MLVTSIPQYIQGLANAKVDLTTVNATVLYTAPSGADFNASIISSILVSEDSGNADTITVTITSGSDVFSLFKVKGRCKWYSRIVNKRFNFRKCRNFKSNSCNSQ